MIGRQVRRAGAVAIAAALLVFLLVPGVSAHNTRSVFVGSSVDGVLTSTTVSAGEATVFVVSVVNTGKQTLTHVSVAIGADGNPKVEANPQTKITPTAPIAFPAGVSASAAGCTGGSGSALACSVGTLKKGAGWTTTVTVTTTTGVKGQTIPIKAVASVKEGDKDNGWGYGWGHGSNRAASSGKHHDGNADTYAAEGTIKVLPFSCDAVTAYRPAGTSPIVTTPCAVTGSAQQQSSIVLPAGLTTVTLTDGPDGTKCPAGKGSSCIGNPVNAQIVGDSTADVVKWVITFNVKGSKIQLDKLRVVHENDAGVQDPAGGFSLKHNACKSGSSINCGTATLSKDCKTLTITVQTAGNGKVRLLG